MKSRFFYTSLIITLYMITNLSFSQDVIFLRSGKKIDAKVLEISKENVKYKDFNDQDGPIRVLDSPEIYMIKYANGKEEVFPEPDYTQTRPQGMMQRGKMFQGKNNFYKNGGDKYFASFAIGHGPSYGWMGLRYQGRIGKDLGFGWHAGIGIFPEMDFIVSIKNTYLLYSGGVKFFWHQGWYTGIQYGTFIVVVDDYWDYHYIYSGPRERILHGPTLTTGIDHFFNKFIGINGAFGISYDVENLGLGPRVMPAIDVGVIVKW